MFQRDDTRNRRPRGVCWYSHTFANGVEVSCLAGASGRANVAHEGDEHARVSSPDRTPRAFSRPPRAPVTAIARSAADAEDHALGLRDMNFLFLVDVPQEV